MHRFGKGVWGQGIEISTEVVNGVCPHCEKEVVVVSLFTNRFRCMNCGGDTTQKVNGVISYIPFSTKGGHSINLAQVNGADKA